MLPRLSDGGYDMVFVDADGSNTPSTSSKVCGCCGTAAYWPWTTPCGTTVRRTEARSMETEAIRNALSAVKDNEDLVSSLLPVGDGLLVAVKR